MKQFENYSVPAFCGMLKRGRNHVFLPDGNMLQFVLGNGNLTNTLWFCIPQLQTRVKVCSRFKCPYYKGDEGVTQLMVCEEHFFEHATAVHTSGGMLHCSGHETRSQQMIATIDMNSGCLTQTGRVDSEGRTLMCYQHGLSFIESKSITGIFEHDMLCRLLQCGKGEVISTEMKKTTLIATIKKTLKGKIYFSPSSFLSLRVLDQEEMVQYEVDTHRRLLCAHFACMKTAVKTATRCSFHTNKESSFFVGCLYDVNETPTPKHIYRQVGSQLKSLAYMNRNWDRYKFENQNRFPPPVFKFDILCDGLENKTNAFKIRSAFVLGDLLDREFDPKLMPMGIAFGGKGFIAEFCGKPNKYSRYINAIECRDMSTEVYQNPYAVNNDLFEWQHEGIYFDNAPIIYTCFEDCIVENFKYFGHTRENSNRVRSMASYHIDYLNDKSTLGSEIRRLVSSGALPTNYTVKSKVVAKVLKSDLDMQHNIESYFILAHLFAKHFKLLPDNVLNSLIMINAYTLDKNVLEIINGIMFREYKRVLMLRTRDNP
ncbi:unnamed protein product [Orchesella dallaii]|uniref:Uncharacterized protein n=1 Tax=Orchesella dallaii TaxID=48710 RepID=A0ABP1Q788_9HEXA